MAEEKMQAAKVLLKNPYRQVILQDYNKTLESHKFRKKAEEIVLEALNEHGFLPEYYEPIPWKEAMPSLDKELVAFYNLNSSHHPSC